MTIEFNNQGQLYARSQVTDYRLWGKEHRGLNVMEFFRDTYEEEVKKTVPATNNQDEDGNDVYRKPGRPQHKRTQYMEGHPKKGRIQHVTQGKPHRTLPYFVGLPLPRRDDEKTHEKYCATMLMLLKPWRDIQIDLKGNSETWKEALEDFVSQEGKQMVRKLSNVHYFHDCLSAAVKDKRAEAAAVGDVRGEQEWRDALIEEDNLFDFGENDNDEDPGITEEALQKLLNSQTSLQDFEYGRQAVEIATR